MLEIDVATSYVHLYAFSVWLTDIRLLSLGGQFVSWVVTQRLRLSDELTDNEEFCDGEEFIIEKLEKNILIDSDRSRDRTRN